MPTTRIEFRRSLAAIGAAAALSLGLVACGGGDDEESPPPATTTTGTTEQAALTKENLISQGDTICAEVNAALGAISASTADESTKASQVSDIYDGLAARLGDLGTPSDGGPPTDVIAAVQDLADGGSDTTELQEAAEDYGFTECAEAPSATTYPGAPSGTDGGSTATEPDGTYTPPATTEPAPAQPAPTTPGTGGGVAPTTPGTGGGSSGGGSSGGSNSGGIGPG